MARTKRNAMLIDEARVKIRTTQLVNRLTDHVLGKAKMESTQVTAALGLLKKSLPDMQSIESKVEAEVRQRVVSDKPMGADEWENKYGDHLGTAARPPESLN